MCEWWAWDVSPMHCCLNTELGFPVWGSAFPMSAVLGKGYTRLGSKSEYFMLKYILDNYTLVKWYIREDFYVCR